MKKKNLIEQIIAWFKKGKQVQADDLRNRLEDEFSETVDDATKLVKETFKASDATLIVSKLRQEAFKEAQAFIKIRIKEIEEEIKRYAHRGWTHMDFEATKGFKDGYFPDALAAVDIYITDTIKNYFENKGFIIERPKYSCNTKIYWKIDVDDKASQLLG